MSTIIQSEDLRLIGLGRTVTKATGALISGDISLFTVAGGVCMITSLYGEVTVKVEAANASKIKLNPTVGLDSDLSATLDIGTTDTEVGELIGIDGVPGNAMLRGDSVPLLTRRIAVKEGVIEQESAGTDGEITWTLTYIPMENAASIVAA